MATTKYIIADQCLRRIKAGNPSVASNVHIAEVKLAVQDAINSLLRPQHFDMLNAEGRGDAAVLCVYENIVVTAYKGVSKCTLPAFPVALPRNQGIHRVYNTDDVLDTAFIPATAAEFEMIASQGESISTVLNQIAYKPRGKDLIFN
jgi:hypothetical protein